MTNYYYLIVQCEKGVGFNLTIFRKPWWIRVSFFNGHFPFVASAFAINWAFKVLPLNHDDFVSLQRRGSKVWTRNQKLYWNYLLVSFAKIISTWIFPKVVSQCSIVSETFVCIRNGSNALPWHCSSCGVGREF